MPCKNPTAVWYRDAGGSKLLQVGLTSLTARGTALIITLPGINLSDSAYWPFPIFPFPINRRYAEEA